MTIRVKESKAPTEEDCVRHITIFYSTPAGPLMAIDKWTLPRKQIKLDRFPWKYSKKERSKFKIGGTDKHSVIIFGQGDSRNHTLVEQEGAEGVEQTFFKLVTSTNLQYLHQEPQFWQMWWLEWWLKYANVLNRIPVWISNGIILTTSKRYVWKQDPVCKQTAKQNMQKKYRF